MNTLAKYGVGAGIAFFLVAVYSRHQDTKKIIERYCYNEYSVFKRDGDHKPLTDCINRERKLGGGFSTEPIIYTLSSPKS